MESGLLDARRKIYVEIYVELMSLFHVMEQIHLVHDTLEEKQGNSTREKEAMDQVELPRPSLHDPHRHTN